MSNRARLEGEDYDEYKLSLRTAARLEKKRLKGKAIYTFLYGETNKKPYKKERACAKT